MDHHSLIYGSLDSNYSAPVKKEPIIHSTTGLAIVEKAPTSNLQAVPQQLQKSVADYNQKKRDKKVKRKAAGLEWEDPTLEDWPDNDFRIFCGDLGNEVSDDALATAFKKYPSFVKAKVVRDKRTLKSKGFGFVSLMNQDDFVRAMREMQGKYVGNRPIKLTRSEWQDKSASSKSNRSKFKV